MFAGNLLTLLRGLLTNKMTKYLLFAVALLESRTLNAGIMDTFRYENGETNWQHVSNWSSGILILLLSMVIVNLFFTRRQARKSNVALKAIRNDLELRVQERTATLDESNRLLKETNQLLEDEVSQHVATAKRLRSSESYIRNILKSMPLMLIGLNKDGRITQWNKRAEDISGIKTEDALGKYLWQAYPIITVSPEQINAALSKNETITIKHSQRGQYYFDITIYPLQDQIETGVVILIDDVTKKILAENMLVQSDKMSSMGELASSMAHDINTPLQAILFDLRTFEHLLADGGQAISESGSSERTEKIRNILTDAAERGQHVASIVGNLQAFARGRSDKKRLSDIPDIIEHTLELASDVLSAPSGLRFKDISIERSFDKDLPMIRVYVTELQQVFLSLFRHCCDALGKVQRPGHKPTIMIQVNNAAGALWIKIQHNGVGLSNEEQTYLFEPFFSSKPPEETYDAGKRLSFAYFIITEQHQGQMAVTSDIDAGTTFHLQIQLN
jgi:PAS domain S-box-containing protein